MCRNRLALLTLTALLGSGWASAAEVPKPEHPTPDSVRARWLNLNGPWRFRFDPDDLGRRERWFEAGAKGFARSIVVPFGWESPLSGISEVKSPRIAWYRRTFEVPADFPKSEHVWLHFGAVDYQADVWVNGTLVASHEGGYTPFSADITEAVRRDGPATVVVRAFDPTDPDLPTGKQVFWYTPTSGIWQTVWLESRPKAHIDHFTARTTLGPGHAAISYKLSLSGLAPGEPYSIAVRSEGSVANATFTPRSESFEASPGDLSWNDPKLWAPETPTLHDATLELKGPDGSVDSVQTYFGLRSIARGKFGDEPFERLLLNGKPVYLRAALDQSFNPKGIYTAPDDAFLRRDIELAKSTGLNALRIHIKPDEPRRLYWADRLGLLILEDMPNTWRQNPKARQSWERTMAEVVARDKNHPSIIAWIAFNETWGLANKSEDYKTDRDTQSWVSAMVDKIRRLDPSRLVEDNSPCNYDHVENTDLNSWHFYIDAATRAREHIDEVVAKTRPGSTFNYCPGQKQTTAPLINSEYGSVSADSGDRDVSWGFRDLTTLLRKQPAIQGYVYTELSDIEWEHNGFFNYDRTAKVFGYDAFVKGMTVADLQGADFIGYDGPPVLVVEPGDPIILPIFVSHYSERTEPPMLRWSFQAVYAFGAKQEVLSRPDPDEPIAWTPYGVTKLGPIKMQAPGEPCVGAIGMTLVDRQGKQIAANFVNVVVRPEAPQARIEHASGEKNAVKVRFAPGDFARKHWSGPVANVPGKVSGQGRGSFEYRLKLPELVVKARPESIALWVEAGSRAGKAKVDWPERLKGQDYPQTEARKWPSTLELTVNGHALGRASLPDDPADARGVLSHLRAHEHGSHGEMVALGGTLPESVRADLAAGKPLTLRLSVPEDAPRPGGLSLYGALMGAYPSDPTLVIRTRDPIPADLGVRTDDPIAIDSFASRQTALVAAGDSGQEKPTSWAYTTTEPGPGLGWTEPGFDDGAWKRGPGGFGTAGTPALRVSTPWDTKSIRLRTTVELPKLGPDDDLVLHLFHDEDVEVFVNGQPLVRERGFVNSYDDRTLTAAQKALFHPGANTLAVSCRQTDGGQGVDLGLTLLRGE